MCAAVTNRHDDWWVYLIRCADNSLYTGITTDVARRFEEHAAQGPKTAKYLRGKGPLTLVFKKRIGNRSQASQVEYRIKRLSKAQKESLIRFKRNIDAILRELEI